MNNATVIDQSVGVQRPVVFRPVSFRRLTLVAALTLGLLATVQAKEDMAAFDWNPQTLAAMQSGDVDKGRTIAEDRKCSKCHGDAGIAEDDETPTIAGQVREYLYKQLVDYKVGTRESRSMNKALRRVEPEELPHLAAYFASLPGEAPAVPNAEPPVLVTQGDHSRLLIGCNQCHGDNGEGRGMQVPALAGQKIDHFIETMQAYREGERANDEYGRMRFIASQLTEEEIADIAAYYAAPRTPDS